MGTGSIQLARVFGIRIGASPSWFVVALIFIVWLSTAYDDQYGQTTGYIMAVASVALFFLSLTLHELGHAWVARRNGIEIAGIDLWFFGGIAKLNRDAASPGEEFRVSAAGPAVTLLIVVLSCVGGVLVGGTGDFGDALVLRDHPGPALAVLGWLALVNAGLFVFNLIPAFPLDGGRIAPAIAWKLTGDRNRGLRISRGWDRPSPTSSWGWASSCSSAAPPAAGSGGSSWAGSWVSRRRARSSRAASPSAWRA